MSGFGHFASVVSDLERAIARCGVMLGIDWQNAGTVRQLANEAFSNPVRQRIAQLRSSDRRERASAELYALSVLMLRVMKESAEQGMLMQGGRYGSLSVRRCLKRMNGDGTTFMRPSTRK